MTSYAVAAVVVACSTAVATRRSLGRVGPGTDLGTGRHRAPVAGVAREGERRVGQGEGQPAVADVAATLTMSSRTVARVKVPGPTARATSPAPGWRGRPTTSPPRSPAATSPASRRQARPRIRHPGAQGARIRFSNRDTCIWVTRCRRRSRPGCSRRRSAARGSGARGGQAAHHRSQRDPRVGVLEGAVDRAELVPDRLLALGRGGVERGRAEATAGSQGVEHLLEVDAEVPREVGGPGRAAELLGQLARRPGSGSGAPGWSRAGAGPALVAEVSAQLAADGRYGEGQEVVPASRGQPRTAFTSPR